MVVGFGKAGEEGNELGKLVLSATCGGAPKIGDSVGMTVA